MTDWGTLADLGTAVGTLVLAGATFAAVRGSERSTGIAERTLLAGQQASQVAQDPLGAARHRRGDPVPGRQLSITRFVLLPQASSWRCDATRHWSLPAGTELHDLGFT